MKYSLFFLLVAAAAAQPPGPGWMKLFNGKDLTGWQTVGKERWIVEDGAIVGESINKGNGFVKTEKTYKDFHLFLRYKCDTEINSGVFIHSDIVEDISKIKFKQIEIDSRVGGHTGGLHGDRSTPTNARGWIVWPAPENEAVIDPYGWNEMLILSEGNRLRTYVNSVQMIDFTDPKPNNTDGIIALQLHSGHVSKIRFKDIWIRDLTKR